MAEPSKEASAFTEALEPDDADSSSEESGPASANASSNRSSTHHTARTESTKRSLTHEETKAVNRTKRVVYLSLICAAVGVGLATYFILRHNEEKEFEAAFYNYARDIYATAASHEAKILGIIHLLSTALTAYSRGRPAAWPNVTLPNFDMQATEAEGLTGVQVIAFAPIVTEENLPSWEQYAVENQGWIEDDWSYRDAEFDAGGISPIVYYDRPDATNAHGMHVPLWQTGPAPYNASIINFDLFRDPALHNVIKDVMTARQMLMSGIIDVSLLLDYIVHDHTDDGQPRSIIAIPVFDDFIDDANVTGVIMADMAWKAMFLETLPIGTNGILANVDGSCGSSFTYVLNGPMAAYVGDDLSNESLIYQTTYFFEFAPDTRYDGHYGRLSGSHCEYSLNILATKSFQQTYFTRGPAVFASIVVLSFLFTAFVFAVYDWTVYRRQARLSNTAERTHAIVSSLFPRDVRDRLIADAEEEARQEQAGSTKRFRPTARNQLKGFLEANDDGDTSDGFIFKSKPIADLFPDVTIMFADLVGFTAWSSMREPAHVFTLLETIYHEFDQIAKRRQVFKVETVGDCYVAACGLPEPRKNHATVMARFSRDCLYQIHSLVRKLEITLGPDTAELGLRFGLHSGPVTAGVLRGERARFQLFGDTMNTASRIESTGAKNKIHISRETAELLVGAGKGHWVRAREDKVHAKGKGELATFWLEVKNDMSRSRSSASSSESGAEIAANKSNRVIIDELNDSCKTGEGLPVDVDLDNKTNRLVEWNTEILGNVLKRIVSQRRANGVRPDSEEELSSLEREVSKKEHLVFEECAEGIDLLRLCPCSRLQSNVESIDFEPSVSRQLHDYIQMIAAMYRENPFHSFEHASHVTMSATKLLSCMVLPDVELSGKDDLQCEKALHDHTCGITSSPLTQFAIILSALIHDADHSGVPNAQLIQEHASIASFYENKSIAEQNSIDVSWDLLMQDSFKDLRRAIYQTKEEFRLFRQVLVNVVLATDIMSQELAVKRQERWNSVFCESNLSSETGKTVDARKASILIEYLIQACDVVHTMQHWLVYRKWNERLFLECYKAFKDGRAASDPSATWYQGEIQFLSSYVIPLAQKLKECGIFGGSSDEYLRYAQQNLREWECKGRDIVAKMNERASQTFR